MPLRGRSTSSNPDCPRRLRGAPPGPGWLLVLPILLVSPGTLGISLAGAQTTRVATVGLFPSTEPGAGSRYSSLSDDGRWVVFESSSPNLVENDTNAASDIFLFDRLARTTTRVSQGSSGGQANGGSSRPVISPNGRYVVFDSAASNLVDGDTNGVEDIFLNDRQAGITERVSVDSAAAQGNDSSFGQSSISGDGRFVAFSSFASNLVPGDTNGAWDAFVRDRQASTTARVSVNSSGVQGGSGGAATGLSGDGRFVALYSNSGNLVAGDTNGTWDIFVHDRGAATTTRVSVDSSGNQANGHSAGATISGDGRFLAFFSLATNLVPGDSNQAWDVFVHDRQTGSTTRASVDGAGAQGNGASYRPAISDDGRFVAFYSLASNLDAPDQNATTDAFVRDRQTGTTTRISVDSLGMEGNDASGDSRPYLSSDGRYAAFASRASNLVGGDTNGGLDVFVRDRTLGTTERTPDDGQPPPPGAVVLADGTSFVGTRSLSSNGRYLAFESDASNLVGGDTNDARDVFVRDLQAGAIERVSLDSNGNQGNARAESPSLSGDGRYVAFSSRADNLVAGDTNAHADIFVRDRLLAATSLVSLGTTGEPSNGDSGRPSISHDGRYVAFESSATNLVASDTNGLSDVFVTDRQSGSTARISVDGTGIQANLGSREASISSDGRCVAFTSDATNLVQGDSNGSSDVFVFDRAIGAILRASVNSDGLQGDGASFLPSLSGDCRRVAFASSAENLADADFNSLPDIFLHDLPTATTRPISVTNYTLETSRGSFSPSISEDGRYVAFESDVPFLVAGDTNQAPDIFVYDERAGTLTRVSVGSAGAQGNGPSSGPLAISTNGAVIAFRSEASNFVPGGDFNGIADLFVRELSLLVDGLETGDLTLWSRPES